MRIGIEAQRLYRKRKHGMDIVVLELIKRLKQIDRVNQYFIFTKKGGDEKCVVPTGNFEIIKTCNAPYPVWEQIILPFLVKKYRIDLLHCTSNTGPLFLKTPIILTLHDIIFINACKKLGREGSFYQKFGNYYRRLVVPRLVPKCALIITVSEYAKIDIARYFGIKRNRIFKVYNGVSDKFEHRPSNMELSLVKKKYNLPDKFIFFLGNTAPKKNLIRTLDAFLNHTRFGKGEQYQLVIADLREKHLVQALKSLNSLHYRDKIHLVGYIPQQKLVSFFQSAKLFLYPSLSESFGLPILEAMTCGTPVISSGNSSIPEIAGGAALLIDPFRPGQIGAAIEEVLGCHKLYDDLVNRGFKRAGEFSSMTMAKQIYRLYLSVLTNT